MAGIRCRCQVSQCVNNMSRSIHTTFSVKGGKSLKPKKAKLSPAAPRRLANDRDPGRIAPESRGVLLNPAKRQLLVAEAEVSGELRRLVGARVEEPERAEAVVEGDDDHVLLSCDGRAVVEETAAVALAEVTPVDPCVVDGCLGGWVEGRGWGGEQTHGG